MKCIEIERVVVENRQRSAINPQKLEELKNSIRSKGLMHPPVLRATTDDTYVLVAGERRLEAIKQLHSANELFLCDGATIPPGLIPYVTLTDLTEIDYIEAELEENLLREDLTWQDRTKALSDLHRLRQAQDPSHTRGDTARELISRGVSRAHGGTTQNAYTTAVGQATVIAGFLDDPDVARAASASEAFKIVSRKIEAEFYAASAPSAQGAARAHRLIAGDFAQVAVELRGKQFNAIIADPPYGVGADTFGNATPMKHQYVDNAAEAFTFSRTVIQSTFSLSDIQAYLFLFCDIDLFPALREFARDVGWVPMRTPIIWDKGTRGHIPGRTGWRRSYEMILCASKGNKKLNMVIEDIIDIPNELNTLHAAQKPRKLYSRLLQLVCIRGDNVLDPCCGVGTVFAAAHDLGLKATGVEIDERQVANAKATIAKLDNPEEKP